MGAGIREAVIVEAVRTPIGRGRPSGVLAGWHPVDLLATSLRAVVDRSGIDPALVDDVIAGCVSQGGEQSFNIARNALLAAGFPETVPATTVDRQCGSSQQAVHFAAQGIMAGSYDVAIAAGVESMSRVPMFSTLMGADPYGQRLRARYDDGLVSQGISAELIAARWKLSRAELDEFAARSHRLADEAHRDGRYAGELLAVGTDGGAGPVIARDEGIRPGTSAERLADLAPAFHDPQMAERFPEITWAVHAGNSSQISDGAAAVLIVERGLAERLGLRIRARLTTFALAGADPVLMLTAVIPATVKALERSGLSIGDIDLFEVNEAFASVVLAWMRDTGADPARVNVNGGAIALGHPLGASGARLLTTLVHAMEFRGARYGLQAMCEGGGMANATIIERIG